MKYFYVFIITFILSTAIGKAREEVLYKKVNATQLFMEVYSPPKMESSKTYPAIVLFWGEGRNGGQRAQFLNQTEYFSSRGLVCFLGDYRTSGKHQTSPFESLKDAKLAIRFVRKNTDKFGVDKTRIITTGGFAGGHLATATALIDTHKEATYSCIPNALVLFKPVVDNGRLKGIAYIRG